jgi:two-component system phosphate regulon sensor histidine kinase PhoR
MRPVSNHKLLALYAILPLSILCGVFVLFIANWSDAILLSILVFVCGYTIFYYLLNRFIYKKIQLIFKNIHRQKTAHLKKGTDDPIGAVSEEVFAWAKERREEIADLKEQENFRREFIGNISHELKTPIFNMQGYLHTLLDGALSDPKVNKRFLEKAAASADRLAELVKDLNVIGDLESGRNSLVLKPENIKRLIQEAIDGVEIIAHERDVKLIVRDDTLKNPKGLCDASKIKQVLTNLLVNAIKYGKKGGKVECSVYDLDEHYLVEVSDDGDGIDAGHLDRLFERFYRTEGSRTRNAGGSGLGLAIAKHIMESHGQSIDVRSTLGKGSTFSFTLAKAKG